MDCPTITVHACKYYKALIDSGAAISLIRYSTYQTIDSSFKTVIQATMTELNTADGSPMTALGMMALQLRIADFIICGRLPDTEILFGIDIQKKIPCHMPGIRKRTVTYRRMVDFSPSPETVNRRQLLGLSSHLSKYHPDTMVSFQSRSKDIQLKDIWHTALVIKIQQRGKIPNINIINGIHNIKGKTSVNILMSNYTNKHITFNKGVYIGHLEPPIDEIPQSPGNPDALTTHNITTERIMAEKVRPDTFKPPHHELKQISKQNSWNY